MRERAVAGNLPIVLELYNTHNTVLVKGTGDRRKEGVQPGNLPIVLEIYNDSTHNRVLVRGTGEKRNDRGRQTTHRVRAV